MYMWGYCIIDLTLISLLPSLPYPLVVSFALYTSLSNLPLPGQSYPDPMVGASRSFIHRISELSSLEGETVRQEKLKKLRKSKKPPSWQSPLSQSHSSRIKTFESVPRTSEQNKTSWAPCSFKWLLLTAFLSSVIIVCCLTWLVFTFWDSWPVLLL